MQSPHYIHTCDCTSPPNHHSSVCASSPSIVWHNIAILTHIEHLPRHAENKTRDHRYTQPRRRSHHMHSASAVVNACTPRRAHTASSHPRDHRNRENPALDTLRKHVPNHDVKPIWNTLNTQQRERCTLGTADMLNIPRSTHITKHTGTDRERGNLVDTEKRDLETRDYTDTPENHGMCGAAEI